jgi:hypothetical protein
VKTLTSQKWSALLIARKLPRRKAIAIENDIRGLLCNFGLKVGVAGNSSCSAPTWGRKWPIGGGPCSWTAYRPLDGATGLVPLDGNLETSVPNRLRPARNCDRSSNRHRHGTHARGMGGRRVAVAKGAAVRAGSRATSARGALAGRPGQGSVQRR